MKKNKKTDFSLSFLVVDSLSTIQCETFSDSLF